MAAWLSTVISLIIKRLKEKQDDENAETPAKGFPDLTHLPPELSLSVLSYLNATDLCLAACVWRELAQDEVLWHSLCRSQWSYVSHRIYESCKPEEISYQRLYLMLDEGTVTFNADPFLGMDYFLAHNLVENSSREIAKFFHHTRVFKLHQMRVYLNARRDVLHHLIELQNFKNQGLAYALRNFFRSIQAPNRQDNYLRTLLEKFSARFCKCNPHLGLNTDMVYLLCFSLIMLSVDLSSPHVKNKMSKREFIRNVRHALQKSDDEFFGHLYDDVYLQGHIAPNSSN